MSRPLKPAPRFVQGPRETDDHFLKRVSLETHRVLVKSQIEDKYKVRLSEATAMHASLPVCIDQK